jgi:hypothetical protein
MWRSELALLAELVLSGVHRRPTVTDARLLQGQYYEKFSYRNESNSFWTVNAGKLKPKSQKTTVDAVFFYSYFRTLL